MTGDSSRPGGSGSPNRFGYDKGLERDLNILDGLVAAAVQTETVEHFEGPQPDEERHTLEDTAGIPTAVAFDIQKQIGLRRAKRAASPDKLAPETAEPVNMATTVTPTIANFPKTALRSKFDGLGVGGDRYEPGGVSGHSKPATKGRMKTSHFEGSIAYWAAKTALVRNERTQRELAAFDINFGGQWLVQPADCA